MATRREMTRRFAGGKRKPKEDSLPRSSEPHKKQKQQQRRQEFDNQLETDEHVAHDDVEECHGVPVCNNCEDIQATTSQGRLQLRWEDVVVKFASG